MASNQHLLNKLNLAGKAGFPEREGDAEMTDMMSDARYLRQSSALINDALQKGFDVLQLANGDIVTTGIKTVVYQYSWDQEKGKLSRTKSGQIKRSRKGAVSPVEADDMDDIEADA